MIQKILDESLWKSANGVVSVEIILPKRVYMGVSVFGQPQYKTVPRPHKIYGSSEDEVKAKAEKYLKENGYDQ